MELSLVRIQTIKVDSNKQVNQHYRTKVQLEEQLSDNDWQMDFCRGTVEALGQMEQFLKEQDLNQSLMQLQSLRVEVYGQLAESFREMVTLKKEQDKATQGLHFNRGVLSVNTESVEVKRVIQEHCEKILLLKEETERNDRKLHFQRGMIAALDEAERIINEELKPGVTPSLHATSPGVMGPDFGGQAMQKPDKVKFPDYAEEYNLPNPAGYQPGSYQHSKISEIIPSLDGGKG